jgi:hypothetical protein
MRRAIRRRQGVHIPAVRRVSVDGALCVSELTRRPTSGLLCDKGPSARHERGYISASSGGRTDGRPQRLASHGRDRRRSTRRRSRPTFPGATVRPPPPHGAVRDRGAATVIGVAALLRDAGAGPIAVRRVRSRADPIACQRQCCVCCSLVKKLMGGESFLALGWGARSSCQMRLARWRLSDRMASRWVLPSVFLRAMKSIVWGDSGRA